MAELHIASLPLGYMLIDFWQTACKRSPKPLHRLKWIVTIQRPVRPSVGCFRVCVVLLSLSLAFLVSFLCEAAGLQTTTSTQSTGSAQE